MFCCSAFQWKNTVNTAQPFDNRILDFQNIDIFVTLQEDKVFLF